MNKAREIISLANIQLEIIRVAAMQEIGRLVSDKKHVFNPDTSGLCVTDEEEGVRPQVVAVDKDQITFEDDSTMDLGDIGTDDLLTVLDTLDSELNPQ